MSKSRAVVYLLCFVLTFGVLGGLVGDRIALATKESSNVSFVSLPNQEEGEPGESANVSLIALPIQEEEEPEVEKEVIKLTAQYPVVKAQSGDIFEFTVELKYEGAEDRVFDLVVIAPQNWVTSIQPPYEEKDISAILLKAIEYKAPEVKVKAVPFPWALPEPGDYVITLKATSGDVSESLELKAVITAKYEFALYTETGRLNTEAQAGKEKHVSLKLENSGSAAIEDITFTSTKPEGWLINYNPEKIDSLEAGLTQEVDVVIEPLSKAIAGDYSVSISADSKEYSDRLELRVTVLTPTIWGWVGIIIVLVIIAGLAVLFRQLGRR